MKVNGYEVNVWHSWDSSKGLPCPIPCGYSHCITLESEEYLDESVCLGSPSSWDWSYLEGERVCDNITHFKIIANTSKETLDIKEPIIDDHLNPDNTKWGYCELSDDELDLIRVVSPAAYKEIGRLVDVIDEAS